MSTVTITRACGEAILQSPTMWSLRVVWCDLPLGHAGEHACSSSESGEGE